MVKRTISMLLALVLVVICVFPALAVPARAEETTEYTEPEAAVVSDDSSGGSGFIVAESIADSVGRDFWSVYDLYSVMNSGTSGFLLVAKCGGFWAGLETDGQILQFDFRNNISPYTSANYPFGVLVDGLSESNLGFNSAVGTFVNYNAAYSYWLQSGKSSYFLTENSYIYFGDEVIYIGNVSCIDPSGNVEYDKRFLSRDFDNDLYSCYSDISNIPGGPPTIPTVTPGGDALDYGTNYYEQNTPGPTLSVTAESPNGGVLSYVWKRYDMNTKVSEIISGATSNSYTVPTDTVGSYIYSCSVTNTYPTGSSVNGTQWVITIYSETQGAGEGITWQLLDDGTLLISGRGPMASYNSNSAVPWYSVRGSVTSIVVSEGVTSLGMYAFSGCNNATSVSLPSTLEHIGSQAFYSTTKLSSIVIPEGVISIGNYAFTGSGVIAVTLPSTLRSLGFSVFNNSSKLVSIYSHSVQPANKSSSTSASIFSNVSRTLSVIYVPFGSGEAYRNHADWAEVADKIVEMEPHADPIDTIEELSAIVEQILAEMEELNSNKGLWENILDAINNWGQQIVDAIGGGFTTEQTPDEFEEKLDDTLTQLGAAGDAMASVQRPDHSAIDFNVGAMVSQSGVAVLASCFSDMMAFEGLQTLVITFVTLSLAAFVLFGRG